MNRFFVNLSGCSPNTDNNKKKILCLHGGGQSVYFFKLALSDFSNDLEKDFEFIYADSPINGNVWYKDKPGGKSSNIETDENWANKSINYLDNLIKKNNIEIILAFSQGVPMSMVYISKKKNNIKKLILCNGYLPTTHLGLMNVIDKNTPISIKTLIFLGKKDVNFYNLGLDLKKKFNNYIEIIGEFTEHSLPDKKYKSYDEIINFIKS